MSSFPDLAGLSETMPGSRLATWPLWGVPGGLFGFAATMLLTDRPEPVADLVGKGAATGLAGGPAGSVPAGLPLVDLAAVDPARHHVAVVLGYLSVACLLVFAAQWRRRVEARFDWSTAGPVVSGGVIASAGALALAYGWLGALSGSVGGTEPAAGDEVFYLIGEASAYVGWFGVLVATGALAWMAWRERLVSRALGTVLGVAFVVLLASSFVWGVAGPAVAGGLVLALASAWLALGRSVVTRATADC